ncbi:MAG TPA: PRC-barrel domain-containing protein, partial [Steroidobacter sp.]|nr:PRC-barrel domain-containing protein [Steroidobacter sp.]
MLRTFSDLKRMSIGATDGELGHIRDAYFDDRHWTLRYLVVNPGSWLTARRVLISPWAIRAVNWEAQRVDVALTREQVRNSPGVDSEQPVSRQYEAEYSDYYGYPY